MTQAVEIGRLHFHRLYDLRHVSTEGFARMLIAEAQRRYPSAEEITVIRADWESAYIITATGDLTPAEGRPGQSPELFDARCLPAPCDDPPQTATAPAKLVDEGRRGRA